METGQENEEKTELRHEPVAGYKTAFYICVIVATLYLGLVFL